MLSTAAANALLKTLEEPPSHVVFVLATTDPQKVPPTIRSRTQHLEFRLLGAETLHDLLESVKDEAGLDVDEEALEAAVRRGRGSARDALSALDQVVASGSADAARPELAAVIDALADGDVNQVLVALECAPGRGWGPQQLGTELIDDLRQVFLAALAPELCTVSGPSLQRFRSVAEAMGLARVVRSMEILGHALVDMREAPDAQVVLEIAAVRAVRPDLDSGMEALSERVSVLERSQSGAPAFPRPGATASHTAAAGPAAAASDPTPEVPGASRPTAEVARRPSLGAVRRSKEAAAPDSGPARRRRIPTPAGARPGRNGASRRSRAHRHRPHARSRQSHRGLGRRHSAVAAGAGQGALRQRSLCGGGRPGCPLRAPQRGTPGAVRRAATRGGGGPLRALRVEGHIGARHRRRRDTGGRRPGPPSGVRPRSRRHRDGDRRAGGRGRG